MTSKPDKPMLPRVFYPRPVCVACRSPELRAYRSDTDEFGAITKYTKCRKCGAKFVLVLEIAGDSSNGWNCDFEGC